MIDTQSFLGRALWYPKFAWIPHRSLLSNKIIWLKKAYRGTAIWSGPGDPIIERNWISNEEYMWSRLRGTI